VDAFLLHFCGQPNSADAVIVVKDILKRIKAVTNPLDLLSSLIDFFGQPLPPFPHLVKAAEEPEEHSTRSARCCLSSHQEAVC
jgi:hypothetical protein